MILDTFNFDNLTHDKNRTQDLNLEYPNPGPVITTSAVTWFALYYIFLFMWQLIIMRRATLWLL